MRHISIFFRQQWFHSCSLFMNTILGQCFSDCDRMNKEFSAIFCCYPWVISSIFQDCLLCSSNDLCNNVFLCSISPPQSVTMDTTLIITAVCHLLMFFSPFFSLFCLYFPSSWTSLLSSYSALSGEITPSRNI